ncbi:GNAT family N-acetyltransferase [uncultured Chryseobacterium sp.]|uniref:GNAT family N-acetyltransferase n=1 Tax=uncultured Chryseobacterium sp. TaxID=259322 RepID=UPI0025F2D5EE|nr:GNAT family N-acetyltransferase [uncultured Chryseobacterium sp.]
MVKLQFYTEEDFPLVNYELDESQSQYTSSAANALKRIADRNTGLEFPVTIFHNGIPRGFFTLDFGEDRLELTGNRNSVLLRSLSIDPGQQGKGIGKATMLLVDDFVRENFRDCHEIVLAVNQNNVSAYRLYQKVGYRYEGKTRMGRSGPQYLMSKSI